MRATFDSPPLTLPSPTRGEGELNELPADVVHPVLALADVHHFEVRRQMQRPRADADGMAVADGEADGGTEAHAVQRHVDDHHLQLFWVDRLWVERHQPRRAQRVADAAAALAGA